MKTTTTVRLKVLANGKNFSLEWDVSILSCTNPRIIEGIVYKKIDIDAMLFEGYAVSVSVERIKDELLKDIRHKCCEILDIYRQLQVAIDHLDSTQ